MLPTTNTPPASFTSSATSAPFVPTSRSCTAGALRRADYPCPLLTSRRRVRNLYWNYPAFKNTTDFESIKKHYTQSHKQINPSRIVAYGPVPHIKPL